MSGRDENAGAGGDNYWGYKTTSPAGKHLHTISIANTGNDVPHENRMPYVVVNRWKRTA